MLSAENGPINAGRSTTNQGGGWNAGISLEEIR